MLVPATVTVLVSVWWMVVVDMLANRIVVVVTVFVTVGAGVAVGSGFGMEVGMSLVMSGATAAALVGGDWGISFPAFGGAISVGVGPLFGIDGGLLSLPMSGIGVSGASVPLPLGRLGFFLFAMGCSVGMGDVSESIESFMFAKLRLERANSLRKLGDQSRLGGVKITRVGSRVHGSLPKGRCGY